jgi:hypothetical protein
MKTSVEVLNDVPTAELETTVKEFELAGATVVVVPQKGGGWTVIATFQMP